MSGGFVLVCPYCGKAWEGILLSLRDDWYPLRASCADCPRAFLGGSVPGSIASVLTDQELTHLPPHLVEREFHLHLNQLEREIAQWPSNSSSKSYTNESSFVTESSSSSMTT